MDKREEIMKAAIHLFSEKGYSATSVQEIAHECKISKGTLYNFFESKEELLIRVIQHNYEKMLSQAEHLNLDESLPLKERLIQKIVVQFDGVRENKDYMSMLLRALPPHDNPKISSLMKRIQFTMTNWYKDCLIEAYGKDVEPYIWDLAVMLQGVLKEYTTLIFRDNKNIHFEDVARFVVERFNTIVQNTQDASSVLTESEMEDYEEFKTHLRTKTPEEQLEHLFEEIRGSIAEAAGISEREEYISAVDTLHKEVYKESPRRFLVKSILLYLEEVEACRSLTNQAETILKTLKVI